MRNVVDFLFLTVYVALICYGASEVISGLLQPHAITMQPVLAVGVIVAGVVGFIDVLRGFSGYGS